MTIQLRRYNMSIEDSTKRLSDLLLGLRFTVKDIFQIKNAPCSWGVEPPFIESAEKTATIIELLLQHGATLVGAVNLSPLSLNISPENKFFPLNVDEVVPAFLNVFGSSFGSALSVAQDFNGESKVDFSLGSDSGGSIRAPAASVGAYGFKGTRTLFPIDGVCLLDSELDAVGIIANDLNILRQVLQLFPQMDSRLNLRQALPMLMIPHSSELDGLPKSDKKYFFSFMEQLNKKYTISELPIRFFADSYEVRKRMILPLIAQTFESLKGTAIQKLIPQLEAIFVFKNSIDGSIELADPSPSLPANSICIHPTLLAKDVSNLFLTAANRFNLYSLTLPPLGANSNPSITITSAVAPEVLLSIAQQLATEF